MGNKELRSVARWLRFSFFLILLLAVPLSEVAMAGTVDSSGTGVTEDVYLSSFARQAYRTQYGNHGGFEVEAPERLAVGSPVSVRLFYQGDPHLGAVPFHAEVTWGAGFRAGTYGIELSADLFSFIASDTRTFQAIRPVFDGGSYTSPTVGMLDVFEVFEVSSLSDLWIKIRVADEDGHVLEDRTFDWTGHTAEGTDSYQVTPDADEICFDLYVGATKDDETVLESEIEQARQLMAAPEHAVTFTLSAAGGATLRSAATQTLSSADYDAAQAATEASNYNLYVTSYVRTAFADLGNTPGTLTMKSSIIGRPYLTDHVWQHAFLGAFMRYPQTSVLRTLPVVAEADGTGSVTA